MHLKMQHVSLNELKIKKILLNLNLVIYFLYIMRVIYIIQEVFAVIIIKEQKKLQRNLIEEMVQTNI